MDHPRTIKALSERWWYRLIKVIFIAAETLIIGLGVLIIFFIYYNQGINYQKTIVSCDNGLSTTLDKVTTTASLSEVTYASNYSYYPLEQSLKATCSHYVTLTDGSSVLTINYKNIDYKKVTGVDGHSYNSIGNFLPFYPDSKFDNYKVDIVRDSQLLKCLEYSLILGFVVSILFEFLRRLFYYIVLGKLFPLRG